MLMTMPGLLCSFLELILVSSFAAADVHRINHTINSEKAVIWNVCVCVCVGGGTIANGKPGRSANFH